MFDFEVHMVASNRARAAFSRRQARDRAVELLGMVGVPNPASASAFNALALADEVLNVAREDLARARTALIAYKQSRLTE
jgi:hypothetical protein